MDEATRKQALAADPDVSTWVTANAGSGKTRVLTDRVARLLLAGAAPQNILCLTYTKAAASEMQNRLFDRLGAWAMASDDDLRGALTGMGVAADVDLGPARTLFARAIETPGGLRIQTIHSFCASLLRRYPLEAGVSPGFVEMTDRDAARLRADVVEAIAQDDPATMDSLAAYWTEEDLSKLTGEIGRNRDRFDPPPGEGSLRSALGLEPGLDAGVLLRRVFADATADLLDRVATAMAAGSTTDRTQSEVLRAVVARGADMQSLTGLEGVLLTSASAKAGPYVAKTGKVPTKATREALAGDAALLDDLMERVEAAREPRLALAALARTEALHAFAGAFLPRYAAAKQARGWLDFDDLVLGARDLLTRPGLADWVLYRLDGWIDHILVDEAQDTSPEQWQVIETLLGEMAAGTGARPQVRRTLFVVGDEKQSIYSFMGADPAAFDRMRAQLGERLSATAELSARELLHSFRSSAAILDVVDAVLDLRAEGDRGGRHVAFHGALPGRFDLWPVVTSGEKDDPSPWYDPVDRMSPHDGRLVLADMIAGAIRGMIDAGETVPVQTGGRRALGEGDVLILVRRRDALFHAIIAACKRRGLAIAGADRLRLGADLGVRDIRALLAFLATPEDDLSLATALRSPLLGWSEEDLHSLAATRGGAYLWEALRDAAARHPRTMAMLDDLRTQADFLRPYELIERILSRHCGRARLTGRLGPEAEDGIDELLGQSLAYERTSVPGLTGFLGWLDADDAEVRRQPGGDGGRIRVMTVHGAKGLESPVVILPDTTARPRADDDHLMPVPEGVLWRAKVDEMPAAMADARAARAVRDAAERARLLYVALTRAETWCIVCGAGDPDNSDGTWHGDVEAALSTRGPAEIDTPAGPGLRYATGDWSGGPARASKDAPPPPAALPAWVDAAAPRRAEPPAVAAPSGLGGAKTLPSEDPGGDDAARRRGIALHAALEVLPSVPRARWSEVAAALVPASEPVFSAEEILGVAVALLDAPHLAHLWAPDALVEVDLTGPLPGGGTVAGAVDRLILGPERVLAVDYKSNASIPADPADVPEGILRQMGAYGAVLSHVYPGRRIDLAILWTRTATLMPVDAGVASEALARGLRDLDRGAGGA